MSTLPGEPTALKTKVGLITSANSIQSAIDGLSKFVTISNSGRRRSNVRAGERQENLRQRTVATRMGLALREYQTVLADCQASDAAAARGETAKRQHSAAQESVKTKRQLEALKDLHAPLPTSQTRKTPINRRAPTKKQKVAL